MFLINIVSKVVNSFRELVVSIGELKFGMPLSIGLLFAGGFFLLVLLDFD